MTGIYALACSQQSPPVPQPAPPADPARPAPNQHGTKVISNSDMQIRTHCSLMGYRAQLLAAFPEKLGDRTLYMLDCSKQTRDCNAVTMNLENSPNQLDLSDIEFGSYRVTVRTKDRAVIEETHSRFPYSKKMIIIDTDRGAASYELVGQSHNDDWRAEVKCDEVLKSDPSIEKQLQEQGGN